MVSISDLIKPSSTDEVYQLLLDVLELEGFAPTAWQPFSLGRTLARAFARATADLTASVASLAASAFLRLSAGDWLTLVAKEVYNRDRKIATFAVLSARLVDSGGGPYTITAGQLTLKTAGGKLFVNTSGGTLALNGQLTLSWKALESGASFNVPADSATTLVTPLPGVTAVNLGINDAGSSGAADAETDESLRTRCYARWPELGSGATKENYEAWALGAHADIVQAVSTADDNGVIILVVAGPAITVSSAVLTAVTAAIAPKIPQCIGVTVQSAVPRPNAITATLKVQTGHASSAVAEAMAALADYQKTIRINQDVPLARLYEILMGVSGVVDVIFAAPTANMQSGPDWVISFDPVTLTVVPVLWQATKIICLIWLHAGLESRLARLF